MKEYNSKLVEYIVEGMHYAIKESGIANLPKSTVICCSRWSDVAKFDVLLGMKVMVCTVPTAYDFWLAVNSDEKGGYRLLEKFDEYMETFSMDSDNRGN